MFSFSLVTPPSAEPVTLAEAKAHARIDTDADDALITMLIAGARQWAEKHTNRAFVTQTWKLALDRLPDTLPILRLPRAPLQRVVDVHYVDEADNAVAWPESNYVPDTACEPGRLTLRSGCVWPVPARPTNGFVVTYVAGYGDDGAAVPDPIKMAILSLVAYWYDHRGETDGALGIPQVALALLAPYRVRFAGL